jgi:hypothetical protein
LIRVFPACGILASSLISDVPATVRGCVQGVHKMYINVHFLDGGGHWNYFQEGASA